MAADGLALSSPYLEGVYEPVTEEVTERTLDVIGEIPRELNGVFAHNGANPRFHPGPGHSWFDGDGMVHGIELIDGDAIFRSRFIQTQGLAEDIAAGEATYVGSLAMPGQGKRHKNVANTDLVFHSGKFLALWWEGGVPHELSLPDLSTKGPFDYNSTLTGGLTSHAKTDPKTGELFFISWGPKPPFLSVGVASSSGQITRFTDVPLPGPRVQHDMALSDRYVGVFDFPLMMDFKRPDQQALGFVLDDDTPGRIGLLDRKDETAAVKWFEIAPCFMWHISSAWDEGDEFVLVGARLDGATRLTKSGAIRDDLPLVDGEHRFDSHPYMWRLNTKTGAVIERQLDDAFVEFPRVNDLNVCSGARYSYMAEIDTSQKTLEAFGVHKYDLQTERRTDLRLPQYHIASEMSFAPRDGAVDEDDGYLLGFVTDKSSMTSEFWITPAQALEQGPVARIKLPQRVPPKFHGRWVDARAYS
ncbi:MAG: carotenoid oxygenase family protein [Pseudomonadota bacterium]